MRGRSWKVVAFTTFVLVAMLAVSGFAGAQESDVEVAQRQGDGSAAEQSSRITVQQTQTNSVAGATEVLAASKVTVEDAEEDDSRLVVIDVRDDVVCSLDENATAEITVSDGDARATFTNADGATIRAGQGRITVTGSRSGDLNFPDGFAATADVKVVGSRGIVCDGDRKAAASRRDAGARSEGRVVEFRCEEILKINRSANRDQYDFSADLIRECLAREVVNREDVKGELADTGGSGFLIPIASLLLAGAGILIGRSAFSRRGE